MSIREERAVGVGAEGRTSEKRGPLCVGGMPEGGISEESLARKLPVKSLQMDKTIYQPKMVVPVPQPSVCGGFLFLFVCLFYFIFGRRSNSQSRN